MSDPTPCTCLICQSVGQPDQTSGLSQAHESAIDVANRVGEHGWTVQGVAGYDDDEPEWAYTIGLWHSYRVPEVSMFGLDAEDMMDWLREVAELVRGGLRPQVDDVIPGVLDGTNLIVKSVDQSWYEGLFGQLLDFYKEPPPMLELVWPDKNGRLPWEDGARARCREWQPRLWVPVGSHDVGPWREIALEADD